jgi:maltose O-acetyltransferase
MIIYRNRFLFGLGYRLFNILRLYNLADRLSYDRMRYVYTQRGVKIGANTVLLNVNVSSSSLGDEFIVGDNCVLTNCTLIGHDASKVLDVIVENKEVWQRGARNSPRKRVVIGNNVFIGYGAIVLPGTIIGDNTVVGAGCTVSGKVPSDSIIYSSENRTKSKNT